MTNAQVLLQAAHILRETHPELSEKLVAIATANDFGTKWNARMDELGAKRGTISDLTSI